MVNLRLLKRCAAHCALVGGLVTMSGCDATPTAQKTQAATKARTIAKRLQQACSSPATYDRLKQVVFDEAIRIRNADPVNLDILARNALARMENPVVKSRDETLDVTVCTGRFTLDLPPGAERAFSGKRRLVADIEYAAQASADGSGLVYSMKGAEPIIYKLAAFDLKNAPAIEPARQPPAAAGQPRAGPAQPGPETAQVPQTERAPDVNRAPQQAQPEPVRTPAPTQTQHPPVRLASPSFNCRFAKSPSEQMVCSDGRLAALDRQMASHYFAALSNGDQWTRTTLRRSRNRFLADRERCSSADCIAGAYEARIEEIRDIAEGP